MSGVFCYRDRCLIRVFVVVVVVVMVVFRQGQIKGEKGRERSLCGVSAGTKC